MTYDHADSVAMRAACDDVIVPFERALMPLRRDRGRRARSAGESLDLPRRLALRYVPAGLRSDVTAEDLDSAVTCRKPIHRGLRLSASPTGQLVHQLGRGSATVGDRWLRE
ncbi:hypothetical protein ACFYT4_26160 [Streptomyces sp. NPDC004609]|uniref:hypothetical protein n=1 Tax=Streptomyces sp. NPDC004609 TaxID=3364704 RepID=UPI00369E0543